MRVVAAEIQGCQRAGKIIQGVQKIQGLVLVVKGPRIPETGVENKIKY